MENSCIIQHHVRTGNSLSGHFKTQKQKKMFLLPLQLASGIHRAASILQVMDLCEQHRLAQLKPHRT